MNVKTLDFLIIGAQKAGTTTLFEYLREHPQLYLPPQKGLHFFDTDELYVKGIDWLLNTYYADANINTLWGKATPHYMAKPAQVAPRLAQDCDSARLIAILRHPIQRAFSHFRMCLRRGMETRSFDEAVQEQLQPDSLALNRIQDSEIGGYVTRGEYGRILSEYLNYFPREQLLVVFTADLSGNPGKFVDQVQDFLGVERVRPSSLGQRFYQGGTRQRVAGASKIVNALPTLALRRVIPDNIWRHLQVFYLKFEQWNTVSEAVDEIPLSQATRQVLSRHYDLDCTLLESATGCSVPWGKLDRPG